MTAEEILKQAQEGEKKAPMPIVTFGKDKGFKGYTEAQKGFKTIPLGERELYRLNLLDRRLEMLQTLHSMVNTNEGHDQLSKEIRSWTSDETRLLSSVDGMFGFEQSGADLSTLQRAYHDVQELETLALACQAIKEDGLAARGEFAYRVEQLNAIHNGKNPDEVEKTDDVMLETGDDFIFQSAKRIADADKTAKSSTEIGKK